MVTCEKVVSRTLDALICARDADSDLIVLCLRAILWNLENLNEIYGSILLISLLYHVGIKYIGITFNVRKHISSLYLKHV